MKPSIAPIAATAAWTFGLLLSGATMAAEHRCSDAVSRHLASLGVAQADVETVTIINQYQFVNQEEQVVGYQAWVDLESCSRGQLVIKMSRTCRMKTAFTTSGCRVPGLTD